MKYIHFTAMLRPKTLVDEIETWLIDNVTSDDSNSRFVWYIGGIEFDYDEDANAFRLKFGIL